MKPLIVIAALCLAFTNYACDQQKSSSPSDFSNVPVGNVRIIITPPNEELKEVFNYLNIRPVATFTAGTSVPKNIHFTLTTVRSRIEPTDEDSTTHYRYKDLTIVGARTIAAQIVPYHLLSNEEAMSRAPNPVSTKFAFDDRANDLLNNDSLYVLAGHRTINALPYEASPFSLSSYEEEKNIIAPTNAIIPVFHAKLSSKNDRRLNIKGSSFGEYEHDMLLSIVCYDDEKRQAYEEILQSEAFKNLHLSGRTILSSKESLPF